MAFRRKQAAEAAVVLRGKNANDVTGHLAQEYFFVLGRRGKKKLVIGRQPGALMEIVKC